MTARGFDAMKAAAVGYLGILSVKGGWDWLVKSNASMEQYQTTLNIVMKDTEKAAQTLDWAKKFAAQTPFEILPDIIEATVKLQSYGLTARDILGDIGDMAAAMGKPLIQAVEAVADAQTGELERLKEFGITKNMLIAKAKEAGNVEIVNAQDQITNMEGLNAALISLIKERYAGSMKAQSETLNGMISNLKDFSGTAGRTLGEGLFKQIKPAMESTLAELNKIAQSGKIEQWGKAIGDGLATAVSHAREMGAVVTGLATAWALVKTQALLAAGAMRLRVMASEASAFISILHTIPGVLGKARAAMILFNASSGIIGAIAAVVGLAAGAWMLYSAKVKDATSETENQLSAAKIETQQKQEAITTLEQQS
jgi:hypothetical protein